MFPALLTSRLQSDAQWQQASSAAPYSLTNFKSCDDKTVGTYQFISVNNTGCDASSGGYNINPKHDFSSETGKALDTNDNGYSGETFYMKLPAYDGDYIASTESGVVVECPECVPALTYTHPFSQAVPDTMMLQ